MVIEKDIWNYLKEVFDPEIPVLSIVDLGIVQKVSVTPESIDISIIPTYTACPAMKRIEDDIIEYLKKKCNLDVKVELAFKPAWTTDFITDEGKQKLKDYGIAPPEEELEKTNLFQELVKVRCPKCNSKSTKLVSQFGSTACKAHYKCEKCLEPFDYFKCLK